MRFIRKGGRVIPIKDKRQSERKAVPQITLTPKTVKTTAGSRFKSGAVPGAFIGLLLGGATSAGGAYLAGNMMFKKAEKIYSTLGSGPAIRMMRNAKDFGAIGGIVAGVAAGAVITGAAQAAFGARKKTVWEARLSAKRSK